MLLLSLIWLGSLALNAANAQSVTGLLELTGHVSTTTGAVSGDDAVPTGSNVPYITYSSTVILSSSGAPNMTESNGTATSTTTDIQTRLVGSKHTSTPTAINGTMSTSTTSTVKPTNTQPCNNYPEFCSRKYSNITMVCAHNSPFVKKGNAASNQELDVTTQLNDGVRMLQGQAHLVNGTLYFCHSSCDMLNAGPIEDYLSTVAAWVRTHPYDVITILLGNARLEDQSYPLVGNYVQPIQNSGIARYLYTPPKIPMGLDDWPTLTEMILAQKRVVLFMDYNANQTQVPYILDEFSQMWETPYDPTDNTFPCIINRPPGLQPDAAKERLYLINHNLNTEISFLGSNILIPNLAVLNVTNGLNGTSSVGLSANQCTADWGRPPNFLNVDYYNYGSPINGSVFEVAAIANNVTYNGHCCGTTSFATQNMPRLTVMTALGLAAAVALLL